MRRMVKVVYSAWQRAREGEQFKRELELPVTPVQQHIQATANRKGFSLECETPYQRFAPRPFRSLLQLDYK